MRIEDLNSVLQQLYNDYIIPKCKITKVSEQAKKRALDAFLILLDELYYKACIEQKFTKYYAKLMNLIYMPPSEVTLNNVFNLSRETL